MAQLGSDRRTTTRKPLRRRHRRAHLRCVAPGRCGGEPGNRPPAGRGRRPARPRAANRRPMKAAIGAASLIGIVLVLLLALRRTRALAFLPAVAGLAAGTAACIAVFGQIHVLTLVIGTSLLGITIDFPPHWLGKCYGMPAWQADTAMRRVLPGLTVSLSATLVGYLALIFTPFPALTQTAVFSAAGSAIAYGATVLLLPGLMRDWRPRPWPALHGAAALMTGIDQLLQLPANTPGGNAAREHGLRRGPAAARRPRRHAPWLAMPAALIEQARAIGNITGIMPTSQFFLVQAPDTDTLLRRQAELAARLDILVASGSCAATTHSVRLARPLRASRPTAGPGHSGRPTRRLELARAAGVPAAVIEQELRQLSALPSLELRRAAFPLAERWRPCGWDGWMVRRRTDHTAGSEFRTSACISGGRTSRRHPVGPRRQAQCAVLRDTPGSRRTESRLLCRRGAADLPVPRTRGHVAHIGRARRRHIAHTGVPGICRAAHHLVLLFGLLLVSAIAVDYAIFMYEGVGGTPACLIGIVLGALTTLLSFGMLAASATPAISSFGATVAIGVLARSPARPGSARLGRFPNPPFP